MCLIEMAPQVGLEPTTLRLTAECSAIELLRNWWANQHITLITEPAPAVKQTCGGVSLEFPEGDDDGQARSAQRRRHASDQTHQQRKNQARGEQ